MNELSVGVPFSGCEKYYRVKNIIATREDEAIAIASGAYLCGQKPLVYMQNSGLGNCIDIITSLLKPYNIKFYIVIISYISNIFRKCVYLTYRISNAILSI